LPQNLSGSCGERASINHGFKAVQIGVSAWTAEALKLTMPASVFSRSTECHNQDKVSMGTIAARDCLRVLELTEQVAAAMVMATVQGVTLRQNLVESTPTSLPLAMIDFMKSVGEHTSFLDEDRSLEAELRAMTNLIREGHWELYPHV
jgi:histidine ammonia-lyase